MAKQAGPNYFVGTIGNLTGYKMNGEYYVKATTRHSREKVRKHKSFVNTMRNANYFGKAQKLARKVYSQIPLKERDHKKIWYPLRNKAQDLVRKEMPEVEILKILQQNVARLKKSVKTKSNLRNNRLTKLPDPSLNNLRPNEIQQLTEKLEAALVVMNKFTKKVEKAVSMEL